MKLYFATKGDGVPIYVNSKQIIELSFDKNKKIDYDLRNSLRKCYEISEDVVLNEYYYSVNGVFEKNINTNDDSEKCLAWVSEFVKTKDYTDILNAEYFEVPTKANCIKWYSAILVILLYGDKFKEITFPETICTNIKSENTDFNGFVFPKKIYGGMYFTSCKLQNALMPEYVDGFFTTHKMALSGVVFPKEVLGSFNIDKVSEIKNFTFPEKIGGHLYLDVDKIENVILPKTIGENLHIKKECILSDDVKKQIKENKYDVRYIGEEGFGLNTEKLVKNNNEKVKMACVISMDYNNEKYVIKGWDREHNEREKKVVPECLQDVYKNSIGKGWFTIDDEDKIFYFNNFTIYKSDYKIDFPYQKITGTIQDKELIIEEISRAIQDDDDFRRRFEGYKFCLCYDIKIN